MRTDGHQEAIDGYTWADLERMVRESIAEAICEECGHEYRVEPDAEAYDCTTGCGAIGTVTSPLRKLGLI